MKEDKSGELYKLEMLLEINKNLLKNDDEIYNHLLTEKEKNKERDIYLEDTMDSIANNTRYYSSQVRQLARDIKALKEGEENDS